MPSPSLRFPRRLPFGIALAIAAALAMPSAVRSQDAADQRPSLSEKTSEAFTDLKELVDAKKWDEALALLKRTLAKADPESYDQAVILDTEAKIYWQIKSDPVSAIGPWEAYVQLAARHPNYVERKDLTEHLEYLAYIYYSIATDAKQKDKALKKEYLDRSLSYMKQWMAIATKPRGEDLVFYATLLFYKATPTGEKADPVILDEARKQVENGLLLAIRPREQFYQLLVAIYQQQGEWGHAAEYLELLAVKHPVKTYFQELVAIYNNLAVDSGKNANQQRTYYARAINAAERGQAFGFINSPKDNYNLVSLYNQVGQYGKAVELLESGLKNGKIEPTENNWLILAYFYEQVGENLQAIRVLKEAEETYPDSGELDRQIAELYYQSEDAANVYEYCKQAIAKDHMQQKPFVTYQLLSVVAFELGKYQEALDACNEAIRLGGPKDLLHLKQGIDDAIHRANATKAAVEGKSL